MISVLSVPRTARINNKAVTDLGDARDAPPVQCCFFHFHVVFSTKQWRIQDFPNGGALFCHKWGGCTSCFQVKSA